MKYYTFVIVCLFVHAILNIDIFRKKATIAIPAIRSYRVFVGSIALYFVVDLLWGIFEECKMAIALTVDTYIYFAIMGFTVLSWAKYLINYLGSKGWLTKVFLYFGNSFFLAEIVLLIVNIFTPIFFKVDLNTCAYTAYKARNIMLYVQILMYLFLSGYTVIMAIRTIGSQRNRFITIAAYSIIMSTMIITQIYNPYLPLYSIGCIIGATLLSVFVINNIKDEYKYELELSRQKVNESESELIKTRILANTDPLTNILNKHAYVEEEDRIDKLIASDEMQDFAVAVFDLNGLKHVNDTKGHDAGDALIIDACRTIEKYFGHENLYRFGGDEFVCILFDDLFENRNKILTEFEKYIDGCLNTEKPIIASGLSRYKKGVDNTYHAVFYRADKIMYSRKDVLKEHQHND